MLQQTVKDTIDNKWKWTTNTAVSVWHYRYYH